MLQMRPLFVSVVVVVEKNYKALFIGWMSALFGVS